jgi:DNA repair protein RecN (Recombination protein N)
VIVITHLASIAAMANGHLVVSKEVENGASYTHIRPVHGDERVQEIARMLSGDTSEISLAHARVLVQSSGHILDS